MKDKANSNKLWNVPLMYYSVHQDIKARRDRNGIYSHGTIILNPIYLLNQYDTDPSQ